MTTKLLVRQGGGAAVEVDYATAFSGRKGSPFFQENTPLLQMGQRFANGEAAEGFFKFVDPEAELPSDGLRLRPWCEVRLTDDASGDELTLAWMRLVAGEARRRQSYIGGAEIEHNPQLMDCNLDLRGIPLPNQWHRDAETDEERLTALQARKLNGSASTEPTGIIRDTTDITIADVSAGHLCDFSSPTNLDARNYPEGTEVVDIISEIAEQAGKVFGVVLHHSGGSTHKCLLYIDQDDLTTWTSDVRISDDPADWDPDDATAPTFPPHWMQGAGKELDYTTTIQGLISIWSGTNDDPRTVYVETGNAPEDAEVWVGVYNDGESTSEVQATRRANWILTDRDRPYASNRVSILVKAAQAHLVTAGQAIETKSVVMESGNLQDTFVWRRVAECKIEPAADGLYWLHMSLERPRLSKGASGGPAQPKATSPQTCRANNILLGLTGASLKTSSTSPNFTKEKACDGNTISASHWSAEVTQGVDEEWWAADSGSSQAIAAYRLVQGLQNGVYDSTQAATTIKLYGSNDVAAWTWLPSGKIVADPAANDWTLLETIAGVADTGVTDITVDSYRYWLLHATAGPSAGTGLGWNVQELELLDNTCGISDVGDGSSTGDGDDNTVAPIGHVHAHGYVQGEGPYHDASGIAGLQTAAAASVTLQQVQTNERFPIWGHRGDIGSDDSLPENTLEGVLQCALKGIQGAEIDVRLSSEGTFHLMHDDTVDRTTDGTGAIASKTDAAIAALNIDGGFGYISGSYDVPTLVSVFESLNPYDFVLSIQLNASSDANATALAEQVVEAGWTHRCLIEVSTLSEAAAVKAVSSALTVMVNNDVAGADADANVDWLSMVYTSVTSLSVATGKAPQHVKAYISINDFPADETPIIQDMWDFGVSAYQTSDVDFALEFLASEITRPGSGHWEPVTNGSVATPEIVFDNGDVVMEWMEE